jgi:signal transduction histidine kinase/PAS domain-containing protein
MSFGPDRNEPALVHAFRAISEAGDYAVVMLDPDGRIASWSSAAQRLLRRPAREAVGQRIATLMGTDEGFDRDIALAAAGGQPDHEMMLTRGDGTPFVARVLLAVAHGASEEIAGYVLVIRPATVSGERRAPTVIEKYADAFEHADVVLRGVTEGVTVQDGSGRLLYVNDTAARLCGFENAKDMAATRPEEIVERFDMTGENGEPIVSAQLPGRRVFSEGCRATESLRLRVRSRKTGETWWADLRASAVCDPTGTPELAISMWHDVSAEQRRKEAASILDEASAKLAASLDYASTLTAVAQSLVPALADWSAVDLVESGARRRLAYAHVNPDKVTFARELIERYPLDANARAGASNVLRTGKPELIADIPPELLRASANDAEHLRMLEALGLRSTICVPIVVNGRTEGALTLVVAESGRRYDERDLELAVEIGRRAGTAIAHARSFQSAQRAIRARDEFLAIAGHELRTPLAALSLQLETVKLAFDSGRIDTERAKYAGRVEKAMGQVARLGKLVEELLDVSRVSSGRLLLARAELDLAELTRDVVGRFVDVAARAACELTVEAPAPVIGIWDPERLDQVLSNIVGNALKYGRGKPVVVTCRAGDDVAEIVVRDQGIGIAPEDQPRIFERFERATSDEHYSGLGIGLWIVREIVTGHGGVVSVKSALGAGTEIAVTLPRAR